MLIIHEQSIKLKSELVSKVINLCRIKVVPASDLYNKTIRPQFAIVQAHYKPHGFNSSMAESSWVHTAIIYTEQHGLWVVLVEVSGSTNRIGTCAAAGLEKPVRADPVCSKWHPKNKKRPVRASTRQVLCTTSADHAQNLALLRIKKARAMPQKLHRPQVFAIQIRRIFI